MNHYDGDLVRIIFLEEIEFRFLRVAAGDDCVLDTKVVEIAHVPEEIDRGSPIRC